MTWWKLTNSGSGNGLSSVRYQSIAWANTGSLPIRPLGMKVSEIWIKTYFVSTRYTWNSICKTSAILCWSQCVRFKLKFWHYLDTYTYLYQHKIRCESLETYLMYYAHTYVVTRIRIKQKWDKQRQKYRTSLIRCDKEEGISPQRTISYRQTSNIRTPW